MPYPPRRFSPSLDGAASLSDTTLRPSLFDTREEFIERVSPIGMAAIYFGSFSLVPQDTALSRQALFKLSFAHRHFLQPAGIRIAVERETAILSGTAEQPLPVLAEILARQIDGLEEIEDATESPLVSEEEAALAAVRQLFATDQTLRPGLHLALEEGQIVLTGDADSAAQAGWAEQLAGATGARLQSRLHSPITPALTPPVRPPEVDDESLQAMVLFRLRLVRETEHLPIRVRASRGVVTLQGKVRTEALRRRVENLTRSTLGLRELRSSLSLIA